MSDSLTNKINYQYDALGRLTETLAPDGGELSTIYDEAGNRIQATFTSSATLPPRLTEVILPKRQQGDFSNNAMMVMLRSPAHTERRPRLVGWGNCSTGVLSNLISANVNALTQTALFERNGALPPAGAEIVDWAFTNANLYVVYSNGWVYSAGKNDYGQLGHNDTVSRSYLKRVEYFVQNNISIAKVWAAGASSLSGGGGCVFFQAGDGAMYACGANGSGNLGNAATPTGNVLLPALCAGIDNTCYTVVDVVVSATGGSLSTYMPCSDGRLMVAGYNGQGQLGVTLAPVAGTFVRALQTNGSYLTGVSKVSATASAYGGTALVVDNAGSVWTAGYNSSGQLGLGDTTNRNRFTKVTTISNIVSSVVGGGDNAYCYALSTAGVFYVWGHNQRNNLFLNNTTNPITLPTVATFVPDLVAKVFFPKEDVLAASSQLIVLTAGGMLAYAGENNGLPGVANALIPAAYKWIPVPQSIVEGNEGIEDVFVHGSGGNQRLFITTNLGNLYATGSNADCICTGGYASSSVPGTVTWYRISLSDRLLLS